MNYGVDTTFLVEVEVRGHARHQEAQVLLAERLDAGDSLVLAPQVLAEFVHVIADGRRFSAPLTVDQAVRRADYWWRAQEVVHAFPDDSATRLFLDWMIRYHLGRKRLLDTLLAATYWSSGTHSILTTNARDYRVFERFNILSP